ncbi:MAG: glycosyltransferase family 39 protein [Anaerolineae bacterium]
MDLPRLVKARHSSFLVLLLYALLAVVMTWPVAAQLGTHLPGGSVDLWSHQWTFWWVKQSILQGRDPFYTDLLFYPRGISLTNHNIAWLNIAVWLPLQAIVGSNTAYSLIFIAIFALNGFAMYLLVRELTGSMPAALVGGVVYGFWPYTLSHYGHPNMVVTCWVPLTLLYLHRTLEEKQKRDALIAAIFLALTGLTRWQLLIMGGVAIGLYLLYKFLGEKSCRTRRSLGLLVLLGFVSGALMAPLATPIAIAYLSQTDPSDVLIDEATSGQTDLLAFVLPSRNHPLWSDVTSQIYENFIVNKVYVAFLGYTTIALALYGTVRDWKHARFWVLMAAVYILLALGPQLRVNGQLYQAPMPYRLVGDTLFIRLVRKPDRFNIFLGLPVGMLASLGMAALLRRCPSSRKTALIGIVASLLILREYSLLPYPTAQPITPGWYNQLAQESGHFAVLDLPMQLNTFDKHYMFYQITHGKPLVEGKVSRPPREAFAFIDNNHFLSQLRQNNMMDPATVNVSHQLRTLAEADIRYIILHREFTSPEQLTAWQDWLTIEPQYEDTDLIVYNTDPQLGADFSLAYDLNDEIGLIRVTVTPTSTIQGALIRVDARWGSRAAPGRDYDVCLNLVNAAAETHQSSCAPLSPSHPTSQWNTAEVVRSAYTLHIDHSLPPGAYTLTLTLKDSADGTTTGAPAAASLIHVNPLQPAHPLPTRWADVIFLHGYDLQQSAAALDLTLYWQAQRQIDTSYKVFVHLIDPATGAAVVQDDAVPRHWTYPTTNWQSGEVVEDTITLPLDDVPPGRYHLVIGLYDPATGERLPAYSADGARYPGDAVLLDIVQR